MGTLLGEIFDSRTIVLNLNGTTKKEVFNELVDAISAVHPDFDRALMLTALWEREEKLSTGIAAGVAIPHAVYNGIGGIVGALGISKKGIEYGALDEKPVHVIFMLAMDEGVKEKHLRVLKQIFSLVQTKEFALIENAKSEQDVYNILSRFS